MFIKTMQKNLNFIILSVLFFMSLPSWSQTESEKGAVLSHSKSKVEDRFKKKPSEINEDWPLVSKDDYIGGGVVGTVLGFGIGHGLTGNFKKIGWLFMLGEIGAIATMASGVGMAFVGIRDSENLFLYGYYGFLALKAWETFDVWTRPLWDNRKFQNSPQKSNVSLGVLPIRGGVQAALGMSF